MTSNENKRKMMVSVGGEAERNWYGIATFSPRCIYIFNFSFREEFSLKKIKLSLLLPQWHSNMARMVEGELQIMECGAAKK